MSRKAKTVVPSDEMDSFTRQVEVALDHYLDSAWLGANSPLAAPYLLGHWLGEGSGDVDENERGQALQRVIQNAAERLDAELYVVIQRTYLNRNVEQDNVALALAMNMSERTFYRNRTRSIKEIALQINQFLSPPVKLETPRIPAMMGRQEQMNALLVQLVAGRTVSISGASGIGKTTLAATIANEWRRRFVTAKSADGQIKPENLVLWITFRSGLNDNLQSFVFALAYFLRINGSAHSWRQLIADQGVIQQATILGLLRYDIRQLQEMPLLLCFDDVDILQPELEAHAQIIHLIEELHSLLPLLLIGQRLLLITDEEQRLAGFTLTEMGALIERLGMTALSPSDQQQLWARTNGNPAMLMLIGSLHRAGASLDSLLQGTTAISSIETLLNRMWRYLFDAERLLLMQLSVFRIPSPQDAWGDQRQTLDQLLQRELVKQDGSGGIALLPHIHRLVYDRIPAELKPILHLRAASIREMRGETLEAIYHAIEGKNPSQALWLWFAQRTSEIERGHAAAALHQLAQISAADLTDERDRSALHLSRAELRKMAGQVEEAASELAATRPSKKDSFLAYVRSLEADILILQDQTHLAINKYRESLEILTASRQLQEVTIHYQLSYLHMARLQDLKQANKEAITARIKAESFHANVAESAGDYATAHARYLAAQQLADTHEVDPEVRYLVCSHFGKCLLQEGELDAAIAMIQRAIEIATARGDLVRPLYDRSNLAYALTQAKRYADAYHVANEGLRVAERMQNSYLTAGLAASAAEAAYYLQQLEEAERLAHISLDQEEDFYRGWALVVLALIRSVQGEVEAALRLVHSAITETKAQDDKYSEAYAWKALATIQRAANQMQDAIAAWHAALELYRELGLSHEVEAIKAEMKQVQGV